jgi:LemA protein
LILLFIWGLYNGVVRLNNEVKNSWAQIDVQLKRRFDLIPNLIETVKGYAKHEREVLENVTKARTQMMNATTVKEKASASLIGFFKLDQVVWFLLYVFVAITKAYTLE